mmetsp:Transcript_93686/g.268114  ORF Transcript_93686/g.268114 Transcript_93686/m.268114 type:complete len:223 (-) Transcript_93686:57-725(-)|eukprot:CAMPEP_0119467936 /NCGR_PEP_ID=MMETSP1344-20130328/1908_1 /TAXON_ID=236787 /ORGANISM="Florenciella parvula, Strain CCMP2471" /LENGTH=222 /DNA_ID=CAMNT_0007500357 /DNA_START=390 /DNA_END=1058 /DNA_ORIENTATION=+
MPPLDELGCRRLKLTDPLSPPAAPVVYLTEWTFVAACTYMGLASFASLTLLLDERDRVTNTNSLEGAFNHAAQFSEVQLASGEGWYLWATNVAFHIAVVLEPCIVIGFWALVYPEDNECSFPNCYTVHGIGAVLVVVDGLVNSLELKVKLIHWPLGYAAAWLLSQFLWVYTDHAPDYTVLTLRDVGSAYVAVGGFITLPIGTHGTDSSAARSPRFYTGLARE